MITDIKSAIVFAMGDKTLRGRNDELPTSLQTINGQVLIERLIEQLQEKDINDIYVVTGHNQKMFEYLRYKYNIELVYNKKWFCTNSITAFQKAYFTRHYANCFGTIMLDANVYIANSDIIETSIERSGCCAIYTQDDTILQMPFMTLCGARTQQITGLQTAKQTSGYQLLPISYWLPIDLKRLYDLALHDIRSEQHLQSSIYAIACQHYIHQFSLKPYLLNIEDVQIHATLHTENKEVYDND